MMSRKATGLDWRHRHR